MKRHTYTALLLCACGGATDSHNLGDTADGSDTSTSASARTTVLADFTGAWVGEADDPLAPSQDGKPAVYHFPSGATQIRFEFTDPLQQSSSVTFGAGASPPWPASLERGYPPSVDYAANFDFESQEFPLVEGYAYQMEAVNYGGRVYPPPLAVPDGVLHLVYFPTAVIQPWCEGQKAVPTGDGYSCMGGSSWGYGGKDADSPPTFCTVDENQIDCGKYYLCAGPPTATGSAPPCACNDHGCQPDTSKRKDVFLSRDGDQLVGVFSTTFPLPSGYHTGLGPVRFHRE